MLETINERPKYSVYLNNGVTILCDAANRESDGGNDSLNVASPQIINGQQTTRVLFEAGQAAKNVNVLVRVIQVPATRHIDGETYDELVSEVLVEGTNRQNAIKNPQTSINDRVQVMLERELGKLGHRYLRKREAPVETRSSEQPSAMDDRKEDLAKAVAACQEPGLPRRVGVDKLFKEGEPYYSKIFASQNPHHYLTRGGS